MPSSIYKYNNIIKVEGFISLISFISLKCFRDKIADTDTSNHLFFLYVSLFNHFFQESHSYPTYFQKKENLRNL